MSNFIKNIINLLRIRQYYKNFLIFVGIFFSENLFKTNHYFPLIIGFILLCFTSSINYIINDIIDVESDKEHQEKLYKKPIASGELSIKTAIFLLLVLIIVIVLSVLYIIPNLSFILLLVAIIITGQLYNHVFKNYAFVDILILSTGYLWRSLAGCFIIEQSISSWLLLAIFEVALFLVIAKRKGDLLAFKDKENAIKHKKVYNVYSEKLLDNFHLITAASIFITYSLYIFDKFELIEFKDYIVIISIPILLYILMRYMYLTTEEPDIARNTEKAFLDKGIIIAGLMIGFILLYSFYIDIIIEIITKTP